MHRGRSYGCGSLKVHELSIASDFYALYLKDLQHSL
jgi:hypothetical protein